MSDRLDGKIAVITGATSGIGLATAKLFAAEGAHVFITGRRAEALRAAEAEIGGNVTGIQADSSNADDLDRLFEQVRNEAGRIDVLYANAGGGGMLPLGQITEEHVDEIFGRNVKAVIFTVQKALPLLVKGSSISSPVRAPASRVRLRSVSIPRPRQRFATSHAAGSSI
jgi:NAD(P)-dependent dehydrogenase (short-subunit alcohol dehydrogenase family)